MGLLPLFMDFSWLFLLSVSQAPTNFRGTWLYLMPELFRESLSYSVSHTIHLFSFIIPLFAVFKTWFFCLFLLVGFWFSFLFHCHWLKPTIFMFKIKALSYCVHSKMLNAFEYTHSVLVILKNYNELLCSKILIACKKWMFLWNKRYFSHQWQLLIYLGN